MCEREDELTREAFEAICGADVLADYLDLLGVEFGHPNYDWCAAAARDVIEEMSNV